MQLPCLANFKKWYANCRSANNRDPDDWELEFDNNIFHAFMNAQSISLVSSGSFASAVSSKIGNSTSSTKDLESTLRVKLSDYPSYNGDINGWYNFKKTFEATAEVAGFSDIIEAVN